MAIQKIMVGKQGVQVMSDDEQRALLAKHQKGRRPVDYSFRLGAAIERAMIDFIEKEFRRGVEPSAFAFGVGMAAAGMTATIMLSLADPKNQQIVAKDGGSTNGAFEHFCQGAASSFLPALMATCEALKKPADESAH